jgi:hypothetical protein
MSIMSVALEVTLAALLAGCLFYCWRLDRKLSALRTSEANMRAAAAELTRSIAQAEGAIKAMRASVQDESRTPPASVSAVSGASARGVLARRGARQ